MLMTVKPQGGTSKIVDVRLHIGSKLMSASPDRISSAVDQVKRLRRSSLIPNNSGFLASADATYSWMLVESAPESKVALRDQPTYFLSIDLV